ncbi:MAG: hypothetical protein AVDCRST_MAG69-321, partial [uncultured Solirubrobacteraceae bacterium]
AGPCSTRRRSGPAGELTAALRRAARRRHRRRPLRQGRRRATRSRPRVALGPARRRGRACAPQPPPRARADRRPAAAGLRRL